VRFVLWAAPALVAGCTVIAGLDGDYVMGAASSSVASTAASGGEAQATASSTGGAMDASSSTASSSASVGGAGGAGGQAPLSCDDQYMDAPDYILCVEDETSCTFNTETAFADSCDDICNDYGGECLQAFDNYRCSTIAAEVECSSSKFDTTACVCSKGCGGGPPCTGNDVCDSGACI
jgi:hypothetical protein